ncbi:MAG: hypothetical protein U0Q16_37365 [Bryobacteraceae bacterium]
MVVRGGYSIFAYPESLRLFAGQTQNTMPGQANVSNNANAAEQSPDGLPNYLLRSVPTLIAGVNSKDALDGTRVTGITRGSGAMYYLNPNQPTARAHEWNFFIEREMFQNTVFKIGYATHGSACRNGIQPTTIRRIMFGSLHQAAAAHRNLRLRRSLPL